MHRSFRLAVKEFQPVRRWFFELTLATKWITPCKRVWKIVLENGVFYCVPFSFRSLGRFERCDTDCLDLYPIVSCEVLMFPSCVKPPFQSQWESNSPRRRLLNIRRRWWCIFGVAYDGESLEKNRRGLQKVNPY